MAHEFESGLFVATPAWHGLGTVLDAPPTIAEALKLAGLDWEVELQQLGRMSRKGFKKANRWAIVRKTDDSELGTVGKVWRPLQNAKAFAWFQPIIDAGLATIEAAGSLRGGARVWILAKIVDHSDEIVPGDKVERYILLAHGHDGVLAIRCGVTGVRVVCQNTLSLAINGSGLVNIFHHANAIKTLEAAPDIIMRANAAFDKTAEAFRALAGIKNVTAAQLRAYVDAVFPKKKTQAEVEAEAKADLERILNRPVTASEPIFKAEVDASDAMSPESKSFIFEQVQKNFAGGVVGQAMPGVEGTAWGAYNAMTYFLTHQRGKDQDSRVNNSFFGPEGKRALDSALEVFLQAPHISPDAAA